MGRAPYICEFLSKGRFVQWEKIKQKGRKGRNGGESESYCYYFLYVARIFRPVSDGAHARQYLRILRISHYSFFLLHLYVRGEMYHYNIGKTTREFVRSCALAWCRFVNRDTETAVSK